MDDVLDIVTWPLEVKGASITLAQQVRRGDDVLVEAQVRVAFISRGPRAADPETAAVAMKADRRDELSVIPAKPGPIAGPCRRATSVRLLWH